MVAGLWGSKYAPYIKTPIRSNTPTANSNGNGNGTSTANPEKEFARFQHAVRRLKWKLPYLADAHRRAADIQNAPHVSDEEKKETETMFKLDFFEYYTVLERALVHLLGVWEVEVEVLRNELTHTFHATLLLTFQSPDNPLHAILGTPPVFTHLLTAKQLRNRWKNAEVAGENDSPPPLGAFEIEQMLLAIFGAFERVEEMARLHLGGRMGGAGRSEVEEEEEGLMYVDEMEWDEDVG